MSTVPSHYHNLLGANGENRTLMGYCPEVFEISVSTVPPHWRADIIYPFIAMSIPRINVNNFLVDGLGIFYTITSSTFASVPYDVDIYTNVKHSARNNVI